MTYDIKIDLIPDLPMKPFKRGVGAYEGVVIHDTECPGDSDESEITYFKKNWRQRQAFVHYFCDDDSITQAAKTEYQAWGAGSGNPRYLHVEMITATNQANFNEVYKRTVWLAASKLLERKLGVIDGKTIVSHDWVAKNLGGTTHSDPISYLKKWGKTWADLVKDVQSAYADLSKPAPVKISPPTPSVSVSPIEKQIKIAVEEKVVDSGYLIDGKSFTPIRSIAEAYGANVEWDFKLNKAKVNNVVIDSTVKRGAVSYGWSAELASKLRLKLEWDGKAQTIHFYD